MEFIKQTDIYFRFFDTSIADILRAIDGKSLMGSMILSFCCIDHLAQASKPGLKTDREDYKNYVRNYLGKINPKYCDLDNHIYAIRNSLIHSYGESESSKKLNLGFLFSTNEFVSSHLSVKVSEELNLLQIDLPSFISEIICSAHIFFKDNWNNHELLFIWNEKLIQIYTKQNQYKLLGESHHHLQYFDSMDDLAEIQISIISSLRSQLMKSKSPFL